MDNSEKNVLSIQVRLDGFSFDILNPKNQQHIFFKDIYLSQKTNIDSSDLLQRMEQEIQLNDDYLDRTLTYSSGQYTIVPLEYYTAEIEEQLFQMNHQLATKDCLVSNFCHDLNAQFIFSIPKKIQEYVTRKFAIEIKHPLEIIIKHSLANCSETLIHLHLNSKLLDLLVVSQKKILFLNTFEYSSVEDLQYFITAISTQLEIDREKCGITLSGNGSLHEELIEQLTPYFQQVNYVANTKDSSFSSDYEEIIPYKYFPLFS